MASQHQRSSVSHQLTAVSDMSCKESTLSHPRPCQSVVIESWTMNSEISPPKAAMKQKAKLKWESALRHSSNTLAEAHSSPLMSPVHQHLFGKPQDGPQAQVSGSKHGGVSFDLWEGSSNDDGPSSPLAHSSSCPPLMHSPLAPLVHSPSHPPFMHSSSPPLTPAPQSASPQFPEPSHGKWTPPVQQPDNSSVPSSGLDAMSLIEKARTIVSLLPHSIPEAELGDKIYNIGNLNPVDFVESC